MYVATKITYECKQERLTSAYASCVAFVVFTSRLLNTFLLYFSLDRILLNGCEFMLVARFVI